MDREESASSTVRGDGGGSGRRRPPLVRLLRIAVIALASLNLALRGSYAVVDGDRLGAFIAKKAFLSVGLGLDDGGAGCASRLERLTAQAGLHRRPATRRRQRNLSPPLKAHALLR
jgi:hypothetical protein